MYVSKSGQLVFEAPDPIAIRAILPHAKTLEYRGKPHVAVKHELDAVTILRNIGVDAPSPVNFGWAYPGRYTPFIHQKATVEFLTVHRRAFVLSGMGSGKTAATLWAVEYLKQQGVIDRVVIVCPKSCTHKVWEDEIFQTLMHRTSVVVEGGRERKLDLAASDSDFIIVNHDGLATIARTLKKDDRVSLYIYDEASAIRNGQTMRYKTLRDLLKPTTRLWLLTATPCPNSPTDAWALARLVRPENVPQYFTSFKRQTMIQISNFKWIPKPEATQMVYEALQPAIRFRTEDCIDLPPVTYQNRACDLSTEQKKMLKDMSSQFVSDKDGATITAASAAVKMIKMLQISCIAKGTPVLTSSGWVRIENVTEADLVWDGVEWVSHTGVVLQGTRKVVQLAGVYMTPDHEVLSDKGWVQAQEMLHGDASTRPSRATVRVPRGTDPMGLVNGPQQESQMAMCMPLRDVRYTREPVSKGETQTAPSKLWLSPREHEARANDTPLVRGVVEDEIEMLSQNGQGLQKLRWPRYFCMPSVVRQLSAVLRRYVLYVYQRLNTWTHRQQRALLTRKFPVGDGAATILKHSRESYAADTSRPNDCSASCTCVGSKKSDSARTHLSVQLADRPSTKCNTISDVYDITNAGPRQRFVVRGVNGELTIVHNCGAVYDDTGETLMVDAPDRLATLMEILEEADHKVIVWCPFKHVMKHLKAEVSKQYDTAMINGDTSTGERATIVTRFQDTSDPLKVLIAHPATAAHGLTLTAANICVWYGPTFSAEFYEQANARVARPGQKHHMTIIHMGSTALEWEAYGVANTKVDRQKKVLDLYRKALDNPV